MKAARVDNLEKENKQLREENDQLRYEVYKEKEGETRLTKPAKFISDEDFKGIMEHAARVDNLEEEILQTRTENKRLQEELSIASSHLRAIKKLKLKGTWRIDIYSQTITFK